MGEIELSVASSIQDLISKELPPQPYWIEPFILPKRGMMLFGGEAKTGKSMIMLELCRALASGDSPFQIPDTKVPTKARVLLIECELGIYGLKDRATMILGGHLNEVEDNFWYVSKDPFLSLSSREGVDRLVRLVEQVQPNVLCIDPIGKLHTADENSNTEVAKILNRLERIQKAGEAQEMSVVFSHHFGKPQKEDSRFASASDGLSPYEFRGASKWFDNPDTLVTMKRISELRGGGWRLRTRWVTRHGPPRPDSLITVNKYGNLEARYEGPALSVGPDDSKGEETPKKKDKGGLFPKGDSCQKKE